MPRIQKKTPRTQKKTEPLSPGIVKIRNKKTGEVYIGASRRAESSLRNQKGSLSSAQQTHHNKALDDAYKKHGADAFETKVIPIPIPPKSSEKSFRRSLNRELKKAKGLELQNAKLDGDVPYNVKIVKPPVETRERTTPRPPYNAAVRQAQEANRRERELRDAATAAASKARAQTLSAQEIRQKEALAQQRQAEEWEKRRIIRERELAERDRAERAEHERMLAAAREAERRRHANSETERATRERQEKHQREPLDYGRAPPVYATLEERIRQDDARKRREALVIEKAHARQEAAASGYFEQQTIRAGNSHPGPTRFPGPPDRPFFGTAGSPPPSTISSPSASDALGPNGEHDSLFNDGEPRNNRYVLRGEGGNLSKKPTGLILTAAVLSLLGIGGIFSSLLQQKILEPHSSPILIRQTTPSTPATLSRTEARSIDLSSRIRAFDPFASNSSEAISALSNSKNANNPLALELLGECYLAGLGVEIDELKATRLFVHAARLHNGAAQYQLALLALSGRGQDRDAVLARTLFEGAAAKGDADAVAWLRNHPNNP